MTSQEYNRGLRRVGFALVASIIGYFVVLAVGVLADHPTATYAGATVAFIVVQGLIHRARQRLTNRYFDELKEAIKQRYGTDI